MAEIFTPRAAGMKGASRRWIDRAWDLSLQEKAFSLVQRVEGGVGRKERL